MQFEEFDKKAREAAAHHHPPYDEQAWIKMEKLLDSQLPQKDNDRRRFIFFLLFLLGIAVTGLLIATPWKTKQRVAATGKPVQQTPAIQPPGGGNNESIPGTATTEADGEKLSHTDPVSKADQGTGFRVMGPAPALPVSNRQEPAKERWISSKPNSNRPVEDREPASEVDRTGKMAPDKIMIPQTETILSNKPVKEENSSNFQQNEKAAIDQPPAINRIPAEKTEIVKETVTDKPVQPITVQQKKKERVQAKKSNSFFFNFSAGPDLSFAGSNKLGTTKLVVGAGLGYTFNKRYTLLAGLYSGNKVYTALPDAYHPPAVFYTYYPYLEKVDADCKVLEIPVSLSYHFNTSHSQNWFVTAGLSSFLMKKEEYNYYYKRSTTGPVYQRKWTINNENKHFLSALTLSGGYQRTISRHLSVLIEPYLKLPLTGVGYGKVKLHSAGVLFSVGVNPFLPKTKRK
jgi:hypothetical protein